MSQRRPHFTTWLLSKQFTEAEQSQLSSDCLSTDLFTVSDVASITKLKEYREGSGSLTRISRAVLDEVLVWECVFRCSQ